MASTLTTATLVTIVDWSSTSKCDTQKVPLYVDCSFYCDCCGCGAGGSKLAMIRRGRNMPLLTKRTLLLYLCVQCVHTTFRLTNKPNRCKWRCSTKSLCTYIYMYIHMCVYNNIPTAVKCMCWCINMNKQTRVCTRDYFYRPYRKYDVSYIFPLYLWLAYANTRMNGRIT